jgi:hypothetical protein
MLLSRRTIRSGGIGGYLSLVCSLGAVRYYPFGEVNGTIAVDPVGAADGTYNSATLGQTPGPLNRDPLPYVRTVASGSSGTDIAIPDITFAGDFTISLWCRMDANVTAAALLGSSVGNSNLILKPYFFGDKTALTASTSDGSGNTSITDPDVWPIGGWLLLHIVRSSTVVTVYRDSVALSGVQSVGSGDYALPDFRVGSQSGSAFTYATASYKHLAFFPSALTVAQMESLRLAALRGF